MEIIRHKTYYEALCRLKKHIASLPVNIDKPKLIIAPEVYTFALEREFYTMQKGSFDVRVTSLSKLYYDIAGEHEVLSRLGGIALMRKIVYDNREKLVYYKNAAGLRGFAAKIYEVVQKLRSSGIEPQSLKSANTALEKKLCDLRLLYSDYLTATENRMVDSDGKIRALTEAVRSGNSLIASSEIYFVNFDVFTLSQRRLINEMDKVAVSVTVYSSDTVKSLKTAEKIEVYAASSTTDEYSRVAALIMSAVLSGDAFGDCCVVGENISAETLGRVFGENGIPYYYDRKRPLSDSEPCRLVLGAVSAAAEGLDRNKICDLACNRLCVKDISDRDAFTAYVRLRQTDYLGFTEEMPGDGAERARREIMKFIKPFSHPKMPANDFCQAINDILSAIETEDELSRRAVEMTEKCVGAFGKIYGGLTLNIRELYAAFHETLDAAQISVIPNKTDTVFVGPLNSRRGQVSKHLFIVGANDGVLPKHTADMPLLSDDDLIKLESESIKIDPKERDMNDRFRDEFAQLVVSAQDLFIGYVKSNDSKRSYMLGIIEHENSVERENDYVSLMAGMLGDPSRAALAVPTASLCLSALYDGECPVPASLYEAVQAEYDMFAERARRDTVNDLGQNVSIRSVSVSSLGSYFSCPKRYYFQYILGVKKTESGLIEVTDNGILIHKVVERFVAEGDYSDPAASAKKLASEEIAANEKYMREGNERMRERMYDAAVKVCVTAAKQLTCGSFKAEWIEYDFDKGGENVCIAGVPLKGQIDRVDILDNYARVIDYKSGKKVELTAAQVYNGKKLQLPLYCYVIKKHGMIPAGMFYFPINDNKKQKADLTGYYVADDMIVHACDAEALTKGKSDIIEYDVTDARKANATAKVMLPYDVMDKIIEYAVSAASHAIEEISSGYICASPISAGMFSECDYCDYRQACKKVIKPRKSETVTVAKICEAVDNEH